MTIFDKALRATSTLISSTKKPTVILGLSGGPDSVFLFYVLLELHKQEKIGLIAAHLDHEWRKTSQNDLLFCKSLCEQSSIEFIGMRASQLTCPLKPNGSKEELGRKLRRHFFETLLTERKAQHIALAHHLDDQEETFFIRLMRGTTLDGLTCMKPVNGPYIRPLLDFKKKDILAWLDQKQHTYLIDPTNISENFLRNRIRSTVIPALRAADERFDIKFASTLKHLQAENELLQKITQQAFQNVFATGTGNKVALLALQPALQKRVLMLWFRSSQIPFFPSESHLNEILRFLASSRGGCHTILPGTQVIKKAGSFWFDALEHKKP